METLVKYLLFWPLLVSVVNSSCIDPSINGLDQEDPVLIRYIRDKLLSPPPRIRNSPNELNFSNYLLPGQNFMSGLQGQFGQPLVLEKLFENLLKTDEKRFFIEAGSYDGLIGTNTLRMELNQKWSGLLVEPNPKHYELTRLRHRNAWTIPTCFSTKKHPEIVQFDAADSIGGIINEANDKKRPGDGASSHDRKTLTLQCVPFYSVLAALGNPRVDFFSLDIEGADLLVLKTIPFDKVDISVLMIEVNHMGEIFPGDNDALRRYLSSQGYVFYRRLAIDDIYIKKTLLPFMNI